MQTLTVDLADAGSRRFLTGPQTRRRYGVSDMSLWRWQHNPELNFPKPLVIAGRKYFALAELEVWERAQAAKRA